MNKKGNFLDWFFILAILFMTGIGILVASLIVTTVIDTGLYDSVDAANYSIQKTKQTVLGFDNMMMFVIVGLSVFVLVSSAMMFNHPAFFIAGMFLLFIAVIVAAMVSNSFYDFRSTDAIVSTAAAFPKLTFLFNNLPLYVSFMGTASSIAAYVSWQKQQ